MSNSWTLRFPQYLWSNLIFHLQSPKIGDIAFLRWWPTFSPHKGLSSDSLKTWLSLNVNIQIISIINYAIENFPDFPNDYKTCLDAANLFSSLTSACVFPMSQYWDQVNKKCPAVGLCRPPMGQSVDICLVNCTKDVYDDNRKWMKGFAAELKMNPECKALWRQMLDLGSSLAAAFWAFTSPSPNIHRTHYWTCVPGKTHVWIESAHVNKVIPDNPPYLAGRVPV